MKKVVGMWVIAMIFAFGVGMVLAYILARLANSIS